jgi:MYXO-CTERM domain-containing protein
LELPYSEDSVKYLPVCIFACASLAYGNTITLSTAPGAVNPQDSQPEDATVTLTTETNEIVVTLTNLETNPTAVSQLISGLTFSLTTLDSATIGLSVDTVDSGQLIDRSAWSATPVNDTTDSITNWTVASSGASTTNISLSALGGGPADLIIGEPGGGGTYTNANGSLNNCHACPLILYTATFDLSLVGVSSSTGIDASTIMVKYGTDTSGESVNVSQQSLTPEPNSAFLAFGALGLIAYAARRRRYDFKLCKNG